MRGPVERKVECGAGVFDCPFSLEGGIFFLPGYELGDVLRFGPEFSWQPLWDSSERRLLKAVKGPDGREHEADFYWNSLLNSFMFCVPCLNDPEKFSSRPCRNKHCGKLLQPEDFESNVSDMCRMDFGKYHLCSACWAKFDGQKMRGRFRSVGVEHDELVRITAQLEQMGGPQMTIGHPSDEERYTESIDEWIGWQEVR